MKKLLFSIISAVAFSVGAQAQATIGGLLMDRDIMTAADMYELSQASFTFGTARSMAMAGAFTGVGADLSSISQNPAGVGMYRRNDLSLTPIMNFNRAKTDAPSLKKENLRDRFTFGNIAYAFPVYSGTGTVTGVTVAVGYNRIADFNYSYGYGTTGNVWSIADVMAGMLNSNNVTKDDMLNAKGDILWDNLNPMYWSSALGYNMGLDWVLNVDTDGDGVNDRYEWVPTWIGANADVGHYLNVASRGSLNEFGLSFGMNFTNKFYLGATFGVQALSHRISISYNEDYFYDNGSVDSDNPYGVDPTLAYQLQTSYFSQEVSVAGAGVNFKLGAIYRPIEPLRIGIAFHTPTAYLLDRTYKSSISTWGQKNNPDGSTGSFGYSESAPALEDWGEYGWNFDAPIRLMVGASYTFGNRGLISVDYQRDWYTTIRARSNPAGIDNHDWTTTFQDWFKGSNTIRVGGEFKPTPWLALRAGAGYAGSALKDYNHLMSAPVAREAFYYSGGLGFTLSPNIYIDLAYACHDMRFTDYDLFFYDAEDGISASGIYNTRRTRHTAALTLGFRF